MGRILALDLGDRRIGLAVSDELGWTAQGAGVLYRAGHGRDLDAITARAAELGCDRILVGLPKNMNGTIGPRAEGAIEFAKQLTEHSNIPTIMWDERLTTVEAERVLIQADVRRDRRKKVIDQAAAVLMLQGYLDSRRYDPDRDGKA